jgi:glutamyl-tRNA synthetase
MEDIIMKFVLKNALDYKGSVNPKAVLGQVLRENSDLKSKVPKVLEEIGVAIEKIKGLSYDHIKLKLKSLAPEMLEEKKEEKKVEGPLKALPNAVKGKVVVRIAPSPSGPLHVGHAYGAALNATYAKMYDGKFILRIEDTNPENIYDKAYELIEEDARWISCGKLSQVVVQSSRLGVYYDYAQKLISMGKTYVCTCNADLFRELKNDGKACPCRELDVKEMQVRYDKMFGEYAQGEAVMRLKTDITHKNPAMRDFPVMRINSNIHPKTGKDKKVWPLMVFSVAIDDHDLGVSHVLNGKDHADNAKKEAMIMKCFGWSAPEYKHWGRINFEGLPLSSSKTRIAIEQNEFSGWDDIRLPFLPALKRRGYQQEAFVKFASKIGLSLTDKKVSQEEFWKMINAFNREIVEPKSNRYFFVKDPKEIKIENAPTKKVEMLLHDDFKERGSRSLIGSSKVYISSKDYELEEGRVHRLIDFCNFSSAGKDYKFENEDYMSFKESGERRGRIIHWLPCIDDEVVDVEVLMNDGCVVKGLGEKSLLKVKVGEIVQFEREFFAKVDKIDGRKVSLWYLHK